MNYKKDFYQNCKLGNLDEVKIVASQGNVRDITDVCFLEAVSNGHTDIVNYFVETFHVNIHQDNERALKNACSFQKYDTVKYLLEKGASLSLDNYAAFKSLVDGHKIYKDEKRLDAHQCAEYALLFDAIYIKIKEVIKNKKDIISWASKKGHSSIVKSLVTNLAELNDKQLINLLVKNSVGANDKEVLSDIIKNRKLLNDNVLKKEVINWAIEKHNNSIVYELIDFDDKDFTTIIEQSIKFNNIEILQELINHKKIPDDISWLEMALNSKTEIYSLLSKEISTSPEKMFLKAISMGEIYIADEILKSCNEVPENYKDYLKRDREFYFPHSSQLPTFHAPLQLESKEVFAYILLINADKDLVKKIIINRKSLFLKDDSIVHYLIESYYSNRKILRSALGTVIQEQINLKMDTQGYLVQIAAINGYSNLLKDLSFLGSNTGNFLARYENPENWATSQEYADLRRNDSNHDRQYNVYKKFNEEIIIKREIIEMCEDIWLAAIYETLPKV